ncbi:hypothetical protein ABIA39_001566 [Nocardia sp. GAS34]
MLTYCHIRLRLESIAPLGRDSVPLVYIRRSTSSSSITMSGNGFGTCFSQVRISSHPVRAAPITARTRIFACDSRCASSAAAASASSATNAATRPWSRM